MDGQLQQVWPGFSSISNIMLWHPPAVHRECDCLCGEVGRLHCFSGLLGPGGHSDHLQELQGAAVPPHISGTACVLCQCISKGPLWIEYSEVSNSN